MSRYLSAAIFLAGAAYVGWYNGSHHQAVLMFPGLDVVFPSIAKDPHAQGRATVYLFATVGVLLFLNGVRLHVRDRRAGVD